MKNEIRKHFCGTMLLIAFQNVLKLTYGLRQSRISKNFLGENPSTSHYKGGAASDAAAQREGGEGRVNGDVGEGMGRQGEVERKGKG